MKARTIGALLALVLAVVMPLSAQQSKAGKPAKELAITAVNVTAQEAAKAGTARKSDAALPGDVMEYRLVFTNTKGIAISNVVFADPVPAGLRYVAASAKSTRSDVAVEYSIDNGASWSAKPMVEVMENGVKVKKPAAPEQYTNVRWKVGGALAPGGAVEASFRTRVGAGGK